MSSDYTAIANAAVTLTADVTPGEVVLDPSRWWVVFLYSLFAVLQGLTWSVPGALQPTLIKVYDITADDVQLLTNYGPIVWFFIFAPIALWIDRSGARAPCVFSTACLCASSCARVFARDASRTSIILLHASFVLNALAGPIATAASSKLAEDWFPSGAARTTATSIMAEANMSIGLLFFLFIPFLVPVEDELHMHRFNVTCAVVTGALFFATLVHFPSRPATAPSASAHELKAASARLTAASLWRASVHLLSQRSFLLLAIAYSLLNGFSNIFMAFLNAMLGPFGFSQLLCSWIAFASGIVSTLVAVLVAKFGDPRQPRRAVLLMTHASILMCATFAAFQQRWLPLGAASSETGDVALWPTFACVLALFVGANLAATAALPLMFEMTVEKAFGALPEGSTLMLINTGSNLVTSAGLFCPIDVLGVLWLTWTMLAVLCVCAVLMWFVDDALPRSDFDQRAEQGGGGLLHDASIAS